MSKKYAKWILPALVAGTIALLGSVCMYYIAKRDQSTNEAKTAAIVRSRAVLLACNNRIAKTRRLIGFFSGRWDALNERVTAEDAQTYNKIKTEYREMISEWNSNRGILSLNIRLSIAKETAQMFDLITKKFENLNNKQIEPRMLKSSVKTVLLSNNKIQLRACLSSLNEIESMVSALGDTMEKGIDQQ